MSDAFGSAQIPLRVEGAVKRFGAVQALADVSFELRRRRVVGTARAERRR